jgi:glucosamine-6-phosphate deaminase
MKTPDKLTHKPSKVELAFENESNLKNETTTIPYIVVDNFPKLGLMTALRFIEWVSENPNGVISLPTGKTPEFFIKWTTHILKNWNDQKIVKLLEKYGLKELKKPSLSGLQFVQIDEFYPISSKQHNSFYYYVLNLYIKGFGLDLDKALLINTDEIPLPEGKHFTDIFPDHNVDLSLRYKDCGTVQEQLQQDAIFMIDRWCSEYEQKIRDKGGIGFFLGGIGPDGHIAFNTRGSDMHSTTRLTATNFETQAVAAADLGGIEVSSQRKVITIGLETITYNPDAVAIIIAAGEAKADIVKHSLENELTNIYPATILSKLSNSRFYLTEGAASKLTDSVKSYFTSAPWTQEKTEKAVMDLCRKLNKYGHRITIDDLQIDEYCRLIPNLDEKTVDSVIESINKKIELGLKPQKNERFLHTGPHHDDIMLGIYPYISNHFQENSNSFNFSILTSGFNAVTNHFVIDALKDTKKFLDINKIQMINFPDFFEVGYKFKWDKDIYHYLTSLAANEQSQMRRGLCHRITRALTDIFEVKSKEQLRDTINEVLTILKKSFDGEKNSPKIQKLKGMIREFEEELVWAHYGVQGKNIEHMRLGFYKGDVFTELPEKNRDVAPILELLKKTEPTVISLAFDPEGSGPDTHYKVLQAIAEALREWQKSSDLSKLRIWGYRNVWYRFNPAEANIIVPVSLNSMASMDYVFTSCYLSQVDASFPSYELNGKFSSLSQKIWGEQLSSIQLLLGKDYFYQNENPKLRASHGLIFLKEMSVNEFLQHARELEKSTEGDIQL